MAGGLGRPRGLYQGYYVRSTVFSARHGLMHETRFDEVGPLLTIMAYRDEHEAIAIANQNTAGSVCRIWRSEEHTSKLQSLMRISYAVFCLKKKKHHKQQQYSI